MILNENILNILENNNKNTFELISNLKSNTLKDDVLKKFDLVTLQYWYRIIKSNLKRFSWR